jgi:DegV family protein with EDD domain
MKTAIITDSNSGITQDEAKTLEIKVVPMPFMINGEEFFEDINLTQKEFYEYLKKDVNVSTSQPSIGFLSNLFDDVLTEYDEIVYIPMSKGLSKSCESAMILAKEMYLNKVYVIDNQRISITQKQSVLDAISLRDEGYSAREIKEVLMHVKFESEIYIMVDTLKYLKKGGRITPAAAAVGGLLKIKPILTIQGFKLDKFRMLNRTLENAKRIMLQQCIEDINTRLKDIDGRNDNVNLEVAYSGVDKTQAMEFVEMIKKEFPGYEVVCQPLSLSVSCHIGTGALAMAVTKKIPE